MYDRYVAELQKEDRPTEDLRFASGFWCLIVSDDPEKPSPRPPTTSSIRPTIIRHGYPPPDFSPFLRSCVIANNCGKAAF